ncbi:MAG: phosphoribosylformylglycinamidine synthase subunit PurQ [Nitrospirae bacterium]|nr:phosphoribosylformylglycinamidine synthase subunit PurQ [Nitrospirota bacterium]
MTIGVVVFPGSNCDHDVYHVIKHVCGEDARFLWHKDRELSGIDGLVLPGGFSYGDYLRCGAIARVSPIMAEVRRFAEQGRPVLGICNGFQVLVEAGILPGALVHNRDQHFICRPMHLRVASAASPYTQGYAKGQVVNFPIAHADGNYQALPDTIQELEDNDRVAFRYARPDGTVDDAANPNGSIHNIAGILNAGRNVLGLMPHPERAAEPELGCTDGRALFMGMISNLVEHSA